MRSFLSFLLLLFWTGAALAQPASPGGLSSAQAQALVGRALATEMRTALDASHPMRYRLRKSSPRMTSTKEIVETPDGDVARLVRLNDQPLSRSAEQLEEARLDALLSDPSKQRHRKQSEEADAGIVFKLLRMLPQAFLYEYAGTGSSSSGIVEKFRFRPNPGFSPPDLETQALTAMTGELWIDATQERVTRLEGHLQQDTDFGWGILGKLGKGGWVVVEQADVSGRQWRIARFQMKMNLRILFKTRNIDTTEEMSQYAPVPAKLDYRQAIQLLRTDLASGGR
ncbi:MAG: hypothetical protein ABSD72_16115 [Terracidiphilus sp.]|jgi:hypothetical protein